MKNEYGSNGYYNYKLIPRAKQLRKNMTRQEKKLWYEFLKDYPERFYRQRPIGRYIADFYCAKAKLVIELDGSQHYTEDGKSYDDMRTEAINLYGIKVIRFSNIDVDTNFEGVCKVIDMNVLNCFD